MESIEEFHESHIAEKNSMDMNVTHDHEFYQDLPVGVPCLEARLGEVVQPGHPFLEGPGIWSLPAPSNRSKESC